jgi:2-(1,2-epoxy-1,2-dihydrophenyl)acetyl-CoA isomerase
MSTTLHSGLVRAERDGGVMTLILDRPDKLNSLNQPMIADLAALLEEARIDQEVRCLALRGEGRAFCSGDDIGREISEELGPRDVETWIRTSYLRLVTDILRLRKPVVVALHGYVLGAALDLALAADFRIAADDVRIGLPPVKWAMGGAGTYLLPHFVGFGRASEMTLLGDTYNITDIADWGLVNRVVPADQLAAELGRWTARLAAAATGSIGYLKTARNRMLGASLAQGLEYQAAITTEGHMYEDLVEGRAAWRERREPHYTGRLRRDLRPE